MNSPMKKFFCFIFLAYGYPSPWRPTGLSLDSCRALAMANNKELLISQEKINAAHYQKKAAFTNYLPNIPTQRGLHAQAKKNCPCSATRRKKPCPAWVPSLSGPLQQAAEPHRTASCCRTRSSCNCTGFRTKPGRCPRRCRNCLVDAFRTDTRNVYAGAITLTQPLYMGGKIRAYNKITKYAEELARQQHSTGMQEVILSTDQAYWQVIVPGAQEEAGGRLPEATAETGQ